MNLLCRALPILLVSFAPAHDSARGNENESRVAAQARGAAGIVKFDNYILDSLFGDSRKQRFEQERRKTATAGAPRGTSAKSRAASRLAERGRSLLKTGDYERALLTLEKSLALDPNPYIYYDLARAHHYLAQYRESSSFVDAAQPWLVDQPRRVAELEKLKNENGRALARQAAAIRAVDTAAAPEQRSDRRPDDKNPFMAYFLTACLALAILYFLSLAAKKLEGKLKFRLNFSLPQRRRHIALFWR